MYFGGKLVGKVIKKKQVKKCRKSQKKVVFPDRRPFVIM
jgi:hypothetical protein